MGLLSGETKETSTFRRFHEQPIYKTLGDLDMKLFGDD